MLFFLTTSNIRGQLNVSAPPIEWKVKEGDEFTWIVTESSSDTYNFLSKDSEYMLKITSIDTSDSASVMYGILTEYDAKKDKKITILDDELYIEYNCTPIGAKFYTPFLDQCFIAPVTFTDFFNLIYDFYSDELGFDAMIYDNDEIGSLTMANNSNSLELTWKFNDEYIADSLEVTEYGETTYLIELEVADEKPEPDYLWLIILIVLIIGIGAGLAIVGVFVLKRKKAAITIAGKTIKEVLKTKDKMPKKEVRTIKELVTKKEAAITPEGQPKKIGKINELITPTTLSVQQEKELKKTEAEMEIEKKELICVIHRGPILGAMYACPNCQILYCQKCAKTLKEKGEKYWSCNQEINP